MKFLLYFIALVLFKIGFAQNLSFDQLEKIHDKELIEAEEYLTMNYWDIEEIVEPRNEDAGYLTFAYNKAYRTTKAESWLYYYYYDNNTTSRVYLELFNKNVYNTILKSLKESGYNMERYFTKDYGEEQENAKKLTKVYRNSKRTVLVSTVTRQDKYLTYYFHLIYNTDYDDNFSDD